MFLPSLTGDPLSFLLLAVYGDNRWSPVGGAGDADTLDLRRPPRSSPPSQSSRSQSPWALMEAEREEEDTFAAASQWWARQDRSTGDEYREAEWTIKI